MTATPALSNTSPFGWEWNTFLVDGHGFYVFYGCVMSLKLSCLLPLSRHTKRKEIRERSLGIFFRGVFILLFLTTNFCNHSHMPILVFLVTVLQSRVCRGNGGHLEEMEIFGKRRVYLCRNMHEWIFDDETFSLCAFDPLRNFLVAVSARTVL